MRAGGIQLMLVGLLLGACSSENTTSATQVMLRIRLGEAELTQRVTHLRVLLLRKDDTWSPASSVTIEKTSIPHWPLDIPILPSSPSTIDKPFEVVIDALTDGARVAQARVISGYARGSMRVLEVFVYACPGSADGTCAPDDCHGEACFTCSGAGTCTPVPQLDPVLLPPYGMATDPSDILDAGDSLTGEGGTLVDGGVSADVATPPVEPPSGTEPCAQEDAMRCLGEGMRPRERCMAGFWRATDACQEGLVCVSSGVHGGQCDAPVELCRGKAGGAVCDGAVMRLCGADGTSTEDVKCTSARHCELGAEQRKCLACLPGEHRCDGRKLLRCDQAQTWQLVQECPESGEVCNATAGACTSSFCKLNTFSCTPENQLQRCNASETAFEAASTCQAGLCDALGGQCDVCTPKAKDCEGNSVRVCKDDGQSFQVTPCEAPRAICAGAGTCVACKSDSQCTAAECTAGTCNVAMGTCATAPAAKDTTCAKGLCDGAGKCGYCGDRVVQAELGEACDDGNAVATDSCNACKSAQCGDGIVQPGEQCDDANTSNTDMCANCRDAACGDGFVQPGEQCDDKNSVDTDACVNCRSARCGDGFAQTGEQCDDANSVNTDACTNCQNARCGDGFRQTGVEACDDGNSITTDACISCKAARCGDGFRQTGVEACDDGNSVDTDGCTSACTTPRCGDGFQQAGEECDDGNASNTDLCTTGCKDARCGDGFKQSGEECDDGNASSTDVCTAGCRNAFCGDGHIRAGVEECELNNGGWDIGNCNRNTCKRINLNTCTLTAQCQPGDSCAKGGFCTGQCNTAADCGVLPSFTVICFGSEPEVGLGFCGVRCGAGDTCPSGLTCVTHVFGGFGPMATQKVCVAPQSPRCCNNNDCYGCFWPVLDQ